METCDEFTWAMITPYYQNNACKICCGVHIAVNNHFAKLRDYFKQNLHFIAFSMDIELMVSFRCVCASDFFMTFQCIVL